MLKLMHCEALTSLRTANNVSTIFMDPPDNIGLKYNKHEDRMEEADYKAFLKDITYAAAEHAPHVYISFNAQWMTDMGVILSKIPDAWSVRWLIQGFTFGQNRKTHFTNNFRPIVMISKADAPVYPEQTRIESCRMQIGDSRAHSGGKVVGDVWFPDFLKYARVTGNSRQRRAWHPTQLHEGLVEDLLLMTTPPDGHVLDPFAGTGTTLRVCKANGWNCTTSDYDLDYCRAIAQEHDMKQVGDALVWYLETSDATA